MGGWEKTKLFISRMDVLSSHYKLLQLIFGGIGTTSTSGLLDKIVNHEHDGEQDQDKHDIRKCYMRKIKPDCLVGI